MRLHPTSIQITGPDDTVVVVGAAGTAGSGDIEVQVDPGPHGAPAGWRVANRGDTPARVRSVAVLVEVADVRGPLRMFRNGYQSWSPTGTATFGVDRDPSHDEVLDVEELRGAMHADQRRVGADELRSEMVTVLADDAGPWLAAFDLGTTHDGTFRLRTRGDGGPELACEAFLGDLELAPGEVRHLHPVQIAPAPDPLAALDAWAARSGELGGARIDAPYQVGWCSWYHYFHDISEAALLANLALADDWPFDVFQLDDGFQSAIGDWLTTNERFPTDLDGIAGAIAAAGRRPGIWIAPFLAAPDSQVARAHPDWLARRHAGDLLPGGFNPSWGGGEGGFMWTLDTSHPEVLDHLESTARSLRSAGFSYIKLDFTYAPSFDGVFHDTSMTPADRVRAGYDAVRRGAGEDAFVLGCGVPLSHVVGVVDGNRIGSDVAPSWKLPEGGWIPGYEASEPATLHAFRNTLARAFMHRRLWSNDPDCLMLRTSETSLSPAAAHTWARAVGVSGGMALVSDDLALLDDRAKALLEESVALGRDADREAIHGRAPRVEDLLTPGIPTTIEAAGARLVVDVEDGTSTFARS